MAKKSWITTEEQEALVKIFEKDMYKTCYFEGGGGTGTSLKTPACIERLHEVFGLGMVRIDHSHYDLAVVEGLRKHIVGRWEGRMVFLGLNGEGKTFVRHSFDLSGQKEFHEVSQNGKRKGQECDPKFEDDYKAIRTNAISKAVFENLLMGKEIYKGEVKPGQAPAAPKTPEQIAKEEAENVMLAQRTEIGAWVRKNGAPAIAALLKDFGTDSKYDDLSEKDKGSFYVFFKANKDGK